MNDLVKFFVGFYIGFFWFISPFIDNFSAPPTDV